jgi:hypothetical protein
MVGESHYERRKVLVLARTNIVTYRWCSISVNRIPIKMYMSNFGIVFCPIAWYTGTKKSNTHRPRPRYDARIGVKYRRSSITWY